MVAIPRMEEEDAGRPSRERESLINERTRIINRMKSTLARLGIRGVKPHLRDAAHHSGSWLDLPHGDFHLLFFASFPGRVCDLLIEDTHRPPSRVCARSAVRSDI